MKVDVVLLTKNSMNPCLKECVESIYDNISVNRLIVVDGGSTDGTVEFLKQFPDVVVIDDFKGNRATSRQMGIETVKTEWHVHVDSDVILSKNWLSRAFGIIKQEQKVGAVWGLAIPIERHTYNIAKSMARFYRMNIRDMLLKQMRSERCMMHDTIIRTETVKDIQIPKDLHIWEDDYIGRHLIKKGYRFLKVKKPYCLHNVSEKGVGNFILNGYLIKKHRLWKFKSVLLRFLLAIPKGLWIVLNTGDVQAGKTQMLSYAFLLKGWLLAT